MTLDLRDQQSHISIPRGQKCSDRFLLWFLHVLCYDDCVLHGTFAAQESYGRCDLKLACMAEKCVNGYLLEL